MSNKVYFIACEGRIKIGYSRNLEGRIAAIMSASGTEPTILGTLDGGYHLEHAIHAELAAFRLKGEWFSDCLEVRRLVRNLLKDGPVVINYVAPAPKPKRAPLPDIKRTPSEWAELRLYLLQIVWPDEQDHINKFADFVELSRADVAGYFDEENPIPMPKLIRIAHAHCVMEGMIEDSKRYQYERKHRHSA